MGVDVVLLARFHKVIVRVAFRRDVGRSTEDPHDVAVMRIDFEDVGAVKSGTGNVPHTHILDSVR